MCKNCNHTEATSFMCTVCTSDEKKSEGNCNWEVVADDGDGHDVLECHYPWIEEMLGKGPHLCYMQFKDPDPNGCPYNHSLALADDMNDRESEY